MKKYLLFITVTVIAWQCKTKKESTTSSKTENVSKTESKASESNLLVIANTRWSGTTQTELNEGKAILFGKCTKCHEQKNIEKRSEKSWLHEIDEMAPKAQLTDEEKLKLTKYVLSFREANAPK